MNFSRLPQLITYPDSLGGSLAALNEFMVSDLARLFSGGVHLLPPFPSSADRGFAPIRYDRVDPRVGSWGDLQALASCGPLTLDVMVNHISRLSPEFEDFAQQGMASPTADMFMRPDKLWPDEEIPAEEIAAIFLRKPEHPFLDVVIKDTGDRERVWATFGSDEHSSDQIDLDWRSPLTTEKYDSWFASLASAGATEIRLDAVGYLTKKRFTSCFMVEPEIWTVLEYFVALGHRHGLTLLPEVHADPMVIESLSERGYPTYDFILPGLVAHSLRSSSADALVKHLVNLPAECVTTLDTHDGIPIQPDLVGVLETEGLVDLVDDLVARGANVNRILGAKQRGIDFDAHQINISYLDAAGSADGLVVARAIQLFSPGRPQVYYQGLLGGQNDPDAVAQTGEGRSINRHNYQVDEVRGALESDVARRQCRLLEMRSVHPAFNASEPDIVQKSPSAFALRWDDQGSWCQLDVELNDPRAEVSSSPAPGHAEDRWIV